MQTLAVPANCEHVYAAHACTWLAHLIVHDVHVRQKAPSEFGADLHQL